MSDGAMLKRLYAIREALGFNEYCGLTGLEHDALRIRQNKEALAAALRLVLECPSSELAADEARDLLARVDAGLPTPPATAGQPGTHQGRR